jgi:hypothetical protein
MMLCQLAADRALLLAPRAPRQVLNWAFAAAPGHPALLAAAEAIAASASADAHDAAGGGAAGERAAQRWRSRGDAREANSDVLERTGPGVWTDTLLTWYVRRKLAGDAAGGGGGDARWAIRFLPRVAFGTHPRPGSADGVPQRAPEVVIAHAFAGGWKLRSGVQALPWPLRPLLRPVARIGGAALARLAAGGAGGEEAHAAAVAAHVPRQSAPFFPVSASSWAPPFDVLLPPPSPTGAGAASGAHLLAWGAPPPRAAPHPAALLLAPLLRALSPSSPQAHRGAARAILLDVGAGHGYYSLAALASGASAAAVEASLPLRQLLERARAANGFPAPALRVHNALLGAASPRFCAQWRRLGGARGEGLRTGRDAPEAAHLLPDVPCALPKGFTTLDALAAVAVRDASYDTPTLVLRLAIGGWEGWALDGAEALMRGEVSGAPPAAVLFELHPRRLLHSGWGDARALVDAMTRWGYAGAAHAGGACDAALRRAQQDATPPPWCVLTREAAAALARDVPRGASESLLFTRLPLS